MSDCFLIEESKLRTGGGGSAGVPKPPLSAVTQHGVRPKIPIALVAIDTTPKAYLAERALRLSCQQAEFAEVKLLTNDLNLKHAVQIPALTGWSDYSRFVTRELGKYVSTSHCLIVQWDGHVLNGGAWRDDFLKCDYLGPYLGEHQGASVYNGGFSLRSKRLLDFLASNAFADGNFQNGGAQEDIYVCVHHRRDLERKGFVIGDRSLCCQFAVDGSSINSQPYSGQFGFHSYLTGLRGFTDRPMIFHHSGDMGDMIYGLASMAAAGGGDLFLSPDQRFPFPGWPRRPVTPEWVNEVKPLLLLQDYVWNVHFTPRTPACVDYDLNAFRQFYQNRNPDNFASLFSLQLKSFGLDWPQDRPWLKVDKATEIPGRTIVVSRSPRFHNPAFPWYDLVQRYGDRMVFVGLEGEAQLFQGMGPPRHKEIPWHRTGDLLELARVIAGAKVFIGNQSTPMALAIGLGQNTIQETWIGNPNCVFERGNLMCWKTGPPQITIPENWLA